MDSCPVCMTETPTCHLVCGHDFCHTCVKEWYMNNESSATCPMCRHNLYFKGMFKHIDKWENSKDEKNAERLFSSALEELFENEEYEYMIEDIIELEEKFSKFKQNWYMLQDSFYEEDIPELLLNPFELVFKYTILEIIHDIINRMNVSKHCYRKLAPKNAKRVREGLDTMDSYISIMISSTPISIIF